MRSQYAKRTDRSQSQIVNAIRCYAQVVVTNMGADFPDLACGWAHKWKFVEVKELDGHFSRGQLLFLSQASGPVDVVIGVDDAVGSIRGDRFLTPDQQRAIDTWLIRNPDQETIRVKKLLNLIGRPIDKSLSASSKT